MERIILGLLMLQRLTIYEIHKTVKQNLQGICSDSLGSIQAAIRKLMAAGLIVYEEFVENSVNKKLYSITDSGRAVFIDWIKTPIDMSKAKNMELSKLLFMGLVPKEKRTDLLTAVIDALKEELVHLETIQSSVGDLEKSIAPLLEYLEQDIEYSRGLQTATQEMDNYENVLEIAKFQYAALQFGIDSAKFQIDWFEALAKKKDGEI